MLGEIIKSEQRDEISIWTIDTSRGNFVGFERNEKLKKELLDFDKILPFAEKYGVILSYPDNFILIFILLKISKFFKLYCHPSEQTPRLSLLAKRNLNSHNVNWLYETCIYYDKEYNTEIEHEGFQSSSYLKGINFSTLEKTMTKNPFKKAYYVANLFIQGIKNYESQSTMFELESWLDIYNAVNCSGNSDVYTIENYFALNDLNKPTELVNLLQRKKKPTLNNILELCELFILDFKGVDLGYARQFKIYSVNDKSDLIKAIKIESSGFILKLRHLFMSCQSVKEFEFESNMLLKEYGC